MMIGSKKARLVGFLLISSLILLGNVTLGASQVPMTSAQSPEQSTPFSEEALITNALEYASRYGLTLADSATSASRNRSMVDFTRQMSLGEWNRTIGVFLNPEARDLGHTNDTPVLVVVIRGDVASHKAPGLSLPNQTTTMIFDNIYLALNMEDGKVISGSSFNPGILLPLYDVPTVAGGRMEALLPHPEETVEPGVLPVPPAP